MGLSFTFPQHISNNNSTRTKKKLFNATHPLLYRANNIREIRFCDKIISVTLTLPFRNERTKKEWNERGTKERKEPATEKKLASIRLDSISNLYLKPFYMKFCACPISKSAIQLLTRDHQIGLIRTERTYVFLLLPVCVWKHLNVVLIIIITMSLHSIRQENTWRRRKAIATWCYP